MEKIPSSSDEVAVIEGNNVAVASSANPVVVKPSVAEISSNEISGVGTAIVEATLGKAGTDRLSAEVGVSGPGLGTVIYTVTIGAGPGPVTVEAAIVLLPDLLVELRFVKTVIMTVPATPIWTTGVFGASVGATCTVVVTVVPPLFLPNPRILSINDLMSLPPWPRNESRLLGSESDVT
jgi:hypothetical protein